jgi:opacity protein-like surface antigen
MPYVTLGFAVGRGDVDRTLVLGRYTKDDALPYGWAGGIGIDIAIRPRWFLRGEYEFVALRVNDVATAINTVRIGAGYRF